MYSWKSRKSVYFSGDIGFYTIFYLKLFKRSRNGYCQNDCTKIIATTRKSLRLKLWAGHLDNLNLRIDGIRMQRPTSSRNWTSKSDQQISELSDQDPPNSKSGKNTLKLPIIIFSVYKNYYIMSIMMLLNLVVPNICIFMIF